MHKLIQVAFAVSAMVSAAACTGQTVYRCGNTYSQAPCGADAKPVAIKTVDVCDTDAGKYKVECVTRPRAPTGAEREQSNLTAVREQEAARRAIDNAALQERQSAALMQAAIAKAQKLTEVLPEPTPAAPLVAKSKQACIAAVRVQLKDPESARIVDIQRVGLRNVELVGGDYTQRVIYAVSVNAKNSYGGYTGAKPWKCDFVPGELEMKSAYPLG